MAYQVHEEASGWRRRRNCFVKTCFVPDGAYIQDEALKETEAAAMKGCAFNGENEFGEGERGAGSSMTSAFFVSINGRRAEVGGGEKASVRS